MKTQCYILLLMSIVPENFNNLQRIQQLNKSPEESVGLYQGDIVLTEAQKAALQGRKVTNLPYLVWPSNSDGSVVVPYTLDRSESPGYRG